MGEACRAQKLRAPTRVTASKLRPRRFASVAMMASMRACTGSSIGAMISSLRAPSSPSAYCASAARARQHSGVVDDQAEILPGKQPVGPRDHLH